MNNVTSIEPPGHIQRQVEEAYLDCLLDDVCASAPAVEINPEQLDVMNKNTALEADLLQQADFSVGINGLAGLNKPFVCQLVKVAGLKLAIPLIFFSRIIAVPDNFKINNQKDTLCFAKFNWQQQKIFVLRLESILFPQRENVTEVTLAARCKIIIFKDKNFSFICDEELKTVTVEPGDVTWRNAESKRLWLAGTVKKAGFSVLDVQGLLQGLISRVWRG